MNTRGATILKSPWAYFGATFLWTWSLAGILILADLGDAPALSFAILILAMIGPGVTGILFTLKTRSREEIRDYWRRIVDFRRLKPVWLAIAVGLPFALQIIAGAIDGVTGGIGLRWGEAAAAFIESPVNQLLTLCIVTLVPFFEELGWRGYAQDLLEERCSALRASLILGFAWSLWHLPASFVPGTYQAGLGIGTLEFWLHFVGIVVLSVVISWIYINTRRSILMMAVFHAVVNLAGELLALSEMGETVYTFCWVSAAVAIILGFGKEMRVRSGIMRDVRLERAVMALVAAGGLHAGSAVVAPVSAHAHDLKAQFQSELEDLHREYKFPGATAAYILADGTVGSVATGMSDTDLGTPMNAASTMLAASVGKTFVSATVLALVAEGRLDLDTPIGRWLGDRPWFTRLPNHETITLRHLLSHTSGLANHVETESFGGALADTWQNAEPMGPEALIGFIVDRSSLFAPGEGWAYSDTGYLLVGLVIEEATGRTYEEEIAQRFITRLDLTLTGPSNRRELPGLATGYLSADNAFGLPTQTTTRPGVMAWHPGVERTGGGLVSHPRDLVVWAKKLCTGTVLDQQAMAELLRSVPVGEEGDGVGYGLGVAIHERGPHGPSYGHGGWIPGYCTSVRYYPRHDVAVAFQVNTDIGMMEGKPSAMGEMERRLAEVVVGLRCAEACRGGMLPHNVTPSTESIPSVGEGLRMNSAR